MTREVDLVTENESRTECTTEVHCDLYYFTNLKSHGEVKREIQFLLKITSSISKFDYRFLLSGVVIPRGCLFEVFVNVTQVDVEEV